MTVAELIVALNEYPLGANVIAVNGLDEFTFDPVFFELRGEPSRFNGDLVPMTIDAPGM